MFIKTIIAHVQHRRMMRRAAIACAHVYQTVNQMVNDGVNPEIGRNGVSVAVGVDSHGDVWGLRPKDAVDIFHGRSIHQSWMKDNRVVASVPHNH